MIMINCAILLTNFCLSTGQFNIQKVVPQPSGESAKVKVKVRVNVHGVFSVSSASLVEVVKSAEGEEPMETDTPAKEEEVKSSLMVLSIPWHQGIHWAQSSLSIIVNLNVEVNPLTVVLCVYRIQESLLKWILKLTDNQSESAYGSLFGYTLF